MQCKAYNRWWCSLWYHTMTTALCWLCVLSGDSSCAYIGSYLTHSQLQSSAHSSNLFLTAAAQNLLCIQLAADAGAPIQNPFLTWVLRACVPGIIGKQQPAHRCHGGSDGQHFCLSTASCCGYESSEPDAIEACKICKTYLYLPTSLRPQSQSHIITYPGWCLCPLQTVQDCPGPVDSQT